MKVQEYLVTFIWLIQQIGQLEQHGSRHILRNTSTKTPSSDWFLLTLKWIYGLCVTTAEDPRAFEKTGLLIGAMQIFGFFARVSDLAWVDLLDKIKGFLDHHLTTGHFYPDAITDINHDYVFNLGGSLTLINYYSGVIGKVLKAQIVFQCQNSLLVANVNMTKMKGRCRIDGKLLLICWQGKLALWKKYLSKHFSSLKPDK